MTQSSGPDAELLLSKMRGVLPPDGDVSEQRDLDADAAFRRRELEAIEKRDEEAEDREAEGDPE
jgi:hypothetical protein